ncbi:glycosyltransferase 87 family protein [Pseudoxanthomonas sp.]|uniref:glycosyltransferase 87 family protein n=1 Tax=Pseudoxanthomonas sp. TaxID=1871049 RepID=UPI00261735C7|nr:glycosyltransferase 87 family protein [Pseudoxanthomonas sp.]WDS34603.1 MAG: glycosyltransferase 87 family protein [Pseudoxanthomonas sp.]
MPDPTQPATPTTSWKFTLGLAALLTLLTALANGQDRNWDLRNYHLYTPSALLDGRLHHDIAAAQLQTWHNPTADIPFAWMVHAGWPGWLISLWLSLPSLLALFFALRLLDRCWPAARSRSRIVLTGVLALTGAAVGPGVGSTFNDAIVAAGAMAALWWVLRSRDRLGAWQTWLPAGLMLGLATGFKLTGVIYCVSLGCVAATAGNMRQAPVRLLATAMGGLIGGVVAAGPWAWVLWQTFGNPLFPYFNQVFQSPDASPVPYNDVRFIPHGLDAWLTVFHFTKRGFMFSEARLADPRILLGLLALGLTLFLQKRRRQPSRDVAVLAVFCMVTLIAWTNLYGIYRYLVGVELLCAIALAGTATMFLPARWPRYVLVIALVAVIGVTKRPSWGRTYPFTTPMVQVQFPPLANDALVVISTASPVGHAVAFLPKDVAAVSLANNFMRPQQCTRLQAAAEARLRDHKGALYLLKEARTDLSDPVANAYQDYGLEKEGACQPIVDNLRPLELCPLRWVRSLTPLCPLTAHDQPAGQ